MAAEAFQARYKSATEIRQSGAIGNLAQGPEILAHGVSERLIAWPGCGFQTEAVHVVTVRPGRESATYAYQLAEEAFLCHHGSGEIFLRDRWVRMEPGDMAYIPECAPRALRNRGSQDFILVKQITPPQLELYEPAAFYSLRHGVMNLPACEKARFNAEPVDYPETYDMQFHEHNPEVRAWNLSPEEVRRGGALFNVYMGAAFAGLGNDDFRLILWPGAGPRLVGFNFTHWPANLPEAGHRHPLADECLFLWKGEAEFNLGQGWIQAQANDCALAPCGVLHATRNSVEAVYGGYASPPQLDLLLNSGYYENGLFRAAPFTRLQTRQAP